MRLESHHDIGITGPNNAGGEMHGVHSAVGQADIVKDVVQFAGGNCLTDGLLDQVAQAGGLLHTQPPLSPHMQNKISSLPARKKKPPPPTPPPKKPKGKPKKKQNKN